MAYLPLAVGGCPTGTPCTPRHRHASAARTPPRLHRADSASRPWRGLCLRLAARTRVAQHRRQWALCRQTATGVCHYGALRRHATFTPARLYASRCTGSRVAQWKRAGPITQRSEDRNLALLGGSFCGPLHCKHPVRIRASHHTPRPSSPAPLPFSPRTARAAVGSTCGPHRGGRRQKRRWCGIAPRVADMCPLSDAVPLPLATGAFGCWVHPPGPVRPALANLHA